jgi:hypothetical protein
MFEGDHTYETPEEMLEDNETFMKNHMQPSGAEKPTDDRDRHEAKMEKMMKEMYPSAHKK